ncbi:uncharacterized protein mbd4 isoform X3 [Pseudoliparis swirei]|uniref:uncharacterized protein mbd4 isoform X3 n=1 Tax=Pseudoliparis swirei TaxID=2059687 RepID=UPI0024BD9AA5|nr:uncharacterized protein mbd4 isoform X3 [Pseudoliparis swirei]
MAADVGGREEKNKSQLVDNDLNSTPLKMHTDCDARLETSDKRNNQSPKCEDDSRRTSTLPHGWIREVRQRKAGKTAGKMDIYITSPQGQRFRSRASLHAFLLKDGEGILDINLFDFTASKDDVVSKGRRRTRKKRHAGGRKETTDSPPSKSKRASPCLGSAAADGEAESRTRAASSTAEEDDVGPRESPSSRQRNTPAAHKVDSRPPVPTLNVEPATESEDEEEGGGGERKDEGDCECSFDLEADSRRDEEAAFPDTAGGSCTPVGDSQNKSKSVEDKRKTSPYFSRKLCRDGDVSVHRPEPTQEEGLQEVDAPSLALQPRPGNPFPRPLEAAGGHHLPEQDQRQDGHTGAVAVLRALPVPRGDPRGRLEAPVRPHEAPRPVRAASQNTRTLLR